MKLKSFGCSFIYGSDLSDCCEGPDYHDLKASHLTWPALIAKTKNMEYRCQAWPGTGNLRILERISYEINDPDDSLFVISWTWIDRLDYVKNPQGIYEFWSWQSIMPNNETGFTQEYYKKYHNQFKDQFAAAVYVQQAINLLQDNNIKFVMTYQDDLLLDRTHDHPGLYRIQDSIEPYLLSFQGRTFLDWSRGNKFPISKSWHPLEAAHAAAADYALDHWPGLL